MRSVVSVVTALVFVLHSSLCMAGSVQVLRIKGNVTGRAEKAAEVPLQQGDIIGSRWTVMTGRDSHVVLRFDDGQLVALQSNSIFRIDTYTYDEASPGTGRMWLSLLTGGLRAITGLVGNTNRSGFGLGTSAATIGVRGTEFMTVDFQGVYSQVTDGLVSVANPAGTEVASPGQTVLAASYSDKPVILHPAAFPQGLFLELQGIEMAAPAASTAAAAVAAPGGAAAGAGPAVGGGLSTPTTVVILFAVIGAAAVAAASGNGGAATTHH
jgi:hypothetical protein